jgi:hypothetical protein
VPAYERAVNVIARISNRVFVGLPLCIVPTFPERWKVKIRSGF